MKFIVPPPAPDKLKELVLHISELSQNDPQFLSTKLNKLVWKADFAAFCETGRTITGASYQKQKFGPVPRAMPIVIGSLENEQRLEVASVPVGTKTGKKPVPKGQANLTAFSQRDLATVSRVVSENYGKNGTQMSDESHTYLAWQLAETGESIPFAAWLVTKRQPGETERKTAQELEAALP